MTAPFEKLWLRRFLTCAVASLAFASSVRADRLEESVARRFHSGYKRNEVRLGKIHTELESLPQPHMREPTGTGGFLSQNKERPTDIVVVVFKLEQARELDAVALFPLRLFTDEIFGENLYWPDQITVATRIGSETRILTTRGKSQTLVRQSLPELIRFEPILTDNLIIRSTGLPQHPYQKWHAAGFAEICVFSGPENVAPRSTVTTNSSRQGYHILAQEFLTDGQTALGLPELSSRTEAHGFVKKVAGRNAMTSPYILTLTYPEDIPIDSIRIDPAIQHSYGQGFPVRFTIDLLDSEGKVVYSDNTYENYPLRPPGLNPYFSSWPEQRVRVIRLKVLETSRPVPQAWGAIALSEITPLCKGVPQLRPLTIREQFRGRRLLVHLDRPLETEPKRALASACDGFTQTGRLLPLRPWIEQLARRQELLEEQVGLRAFQEKALTRTTRVLVFGSLLLLALVTGGASFAVIRNRSRLRKELRTTRASIASDLHDDVGSNLGTIILHVEDLKEHADSSHHQERLDAIYRLTRESVFGLREVLTTTTPEVGRTQNIVAYMQELAGLILGKIDYTFDAAPALGESLLDHRLRKGIILFFKEALYNARRHSGCSHIDISLKRRQNQIELMIADNGKGIDERTRKRPRNLRTLKLRAGQLNADLKTETSPGNGTKHTLSIPL